MAFGLYKAHIFLLLAKWYQSMCCFQRWRIHAKHDNHRGPVYGHPNGLEEMPHDRWRRRGADLFVEKKISLWQAAVICGVLFGEFSPVFLGQVVTNQDPLVGGKKSARSLDTLTLEETYLEHVSFGSSG